MVRMDPQNELPTVQHSTAHTTQKRNSRLRACGKTVAPPASTSLKYMKMVTMRLVPSGLDGSRFLYPTLK